jgi:hypothetical protein
MIPIMTIQDSERVEKAKKILENIVNLERDHERTFFEVEQDDERIIRSYVSDELKQIGLSSKNPYLIELLEYTKTLPKLDELQLETINGLKQIGHEETASDIEFDLNNYQRADANNLKEFQIVLYEHLINNKNNVKGRSNDILIDAFSRIEERSKYSFEDVLDSYFDTKLHASDAFNHIKTHLTALKGLTKPSYFQRFFNINPTERISSLIDSLPTSFEISEYKSKILRQRNLIQEQFNKNNAQKYLLNVG